MVLPRGLYAITPDEPNPEQLATLVAAALAGGAAAVQYRNKRASRALQRRQAAVLARLCAKAGVPLIINDDLALALDLSAAGVHLGEQDGDLIAARRALGPGKLLGASCYDRLELARAAHAAGADYVAFGSMFPSPTKPQAVRAPLGLLSAARRELGLPAVAIGGINLENAGAAIAAGAHAVAVISDLFEAPDIGARARQFHDLFAAMVT